MGVYDIQGKNCVFQIKIGDDYLTVVCAKSFTFNPVTDMKETTTVGSGFWKEYRPRKLSYTITFNGMLQVASLTTQEVAKTLFTYQVQFLPLEYQIIYEDNSANILVVRGTAYVSSSLFDASPVNLVNATQELQGSGSIEMLDQLPIPVNITIASTGDPAIAALIQFKLMNDNGDIVFDSGQLPGASGGDLSHPVNIVGQVQSGTYSYFWQVVSNAIGNQFDLDAPPTQTTNFQFGTVNESSFGVQTFDFTADRNVTFALGVNNPPPGCVAPTIQQGIVSPNGTLGTYYSRTVIVGGSTPFTLSNITKPSWMTVSVSGNIITCEGNPSAGIGQTLSFDVTNACGTVSYSTSITISVGAFNVIINYNYTETVAACVFILYRNAVAVAQLDSTGSGSIVVNSTDVMEARVIGPTLSVIKSLKVEGSTSGVLYDNSTTGTSIFFSWTATVPNTYTITAGGGV